MHSEEEKTECCDAVDLIETPRGTVVCRNCGVDHGSVLVFSQRRAYDKDERKRRVQDEPVSPYGSKTFIFVEDNSKYSPEKLRTLHRMAKINNVWDRDSRTRQLHQFADVARAFPLLRQDVKSTARKIFLRVSKEKGMRGHTIEGISKACIYYACAVCGQSMTLGEIETDKAKESEMRGSAKYVKPIADTMFGKFKRSLMPVLNKKMNEMGIPDDAQKDCIVICKSITKRYKVETSSKSRLSVVAAIIFLVCKVKSTVLKFVDEEHGGSRFANVTQKMVARNVGVTEVTVRNRVKDLIRWSDHDAVQKYATFHMNKNGN